jgi:hypothetical protein
MSSLLDTLLHALLRHRQDTDKPRPPGIALPQERAAASLSAPAAAELWDTDERAWLQESFAALLTQEDEPYAARYNQISAAFGLGLSGRVALLLALCPQWDRKYEQVFALLNYDLSATAPSAGIVWSACRLLDLPEDETAAFLWSPLSLRLLVKLPEGGLSLATPLIVHGSIAAAFHGSAELDMALSDVCTIYSPAQPLSQAVFGAGLIGQLTELFGRSIAEKTGGYAVALVGKAGSGRRFVLRHVAARFGCHVLCVDLCRLTDDDDKTQESCLEALEREFLLHPGFLAFTGCIGSLSAGKVTKIFERVARFAVLVWISTDADGLKILRQTQLSLCEIAMPAPGYGESEALFVQMSAGFALSAGLRLDEHVRGCRMLPGEIQKSLEAAQMMAYQRGVSEIGIEDIKRGMASQRNRTAGELGTVITPYYTWDDMIITQANINLMKLASSHLKYRSRVGEAWGLDRRHAYGKGVCVLLYGSPGTGKTMAAHVLANEAGMDLYKVDGAQLVSKYIGETSKNLSEVFRQADSGNMILFFDEADAVFGKRSQVSDSHDRYANSDTAVLLQRIEQYDGMTILATNLASNIDEAFRRRITYAITFIPPNETERQALWNLMLRGIPAKKLDIPYLAKFELTGSGIRSVVTSACYMAASKEEIIEMPYLVQALCTFMAKSGTNLSQSDLMPYGVLKN